LARDTRALRPLANMLRPLRALATRRDLGGVAFEGANQVGRGGRGRVGSERGFKRGPSAPARGGSQAPEEPRGRKKGLLNPPDEALGRSKGGFSTKLHLSCDGKGRPLSLVLTGGQRHESTQLGAVLDAIRVPRIGRGRPRKRPDRLIADKGYSYPTCRDLLSKRAIPHTIPERRDQRERRGKRPGRKPSFEKETYRKRNVVERCVSKLKQWRAIATRYDKRALNYRAGVIVASLMIWLAS
jgi:transposase